MNLELMYSNIEAERARRHWTSIMLIRQLAWQRKNRLKVSYRLCDFEGGESTMPIKEMAISGSQKTKSLAEARKKEIKIYLHVHYNKYLGGCQ